MVGRHLDKILPVTQVRCELICERGISVGSLSQQLAVQSHFTAVVDSFEINIYPATFRCFCIMVETLAIEPDTPRHIAGSAREIWRSSPFYAPVVRECYLSPQGIVGLGNHCDNSFVRSGFGITLGGGRGGDTRCVGCTHVGEFKPPSIVEFHRIAKSDLSHAIHCGYR